MRTFNSIVTAMAMGPSKTLFPEMERFAAKSGLDVLETFFENDEIPPKIVKMWTNDDDFMNWLAERMSGASTARGWFYKEQPRQELKDQSVAVVRDNFISAKDTSAANAGYIDYRIVDRANRVVEPLVVVDQDRLRDIARTLRPALEADGYYLNLSEAKQIWELAFIHGPAIHGKPKLCAQPADPGWCLHRITTVADGSTDMPETQRFLDRLNDPEAFAAYLYGIASGCYIGRQILWLRGTGSDGKSTFFKSYSTIFGPTAGSIDWTTLKDNAGFAGSLFVNKRFVYIPDNNNPELLNSGLFKSLSDPGSDPVTINHKYGKMYSTELEAHTAVLSNFEPAIRNETHSVSRALYLTIEPRDMTEAADKSITQRFIAELPAFLTYGRECYEKRCRNNTEIQLNEAATNAISDRIDSTNEKWDVILHRYFIVDPDASLNNGKAYARLTDDARLSGHEVKDFRAWLFSQHGVEWKQSTSPSGKRERVYLGLRLRTPADDHQSAMEDLGND